MKDIKNIIGKYKIFINTEEWKKINEERKEKEKRIIISKLLNKNYLRNISEKEFRNLMKSLWASQFWTNKDWMVNKILEQNKGLDSIKEFLFKLLHSEELLHERYDYFRQNVKGIGPSMLTELMTFADPNRYCIWNDKPKVVLPFLEIDKLLPERVFKYQINGKDYEKCIEILSGLRKELQSEFSKSDFIDLDSFLWFIFIKIIPDVNNYICSYCNNNFNTKSELNEHIKIEHSEPLEPPKGTEKQNHLTIQKALVELGILFGYDTYVPPEDRGKISDTTFRDIPGFTYPHLLDTIKHIDVIWFKEEFPAYCFEVEESTDVTKGLLRLYQIRGLKFIPIIVGPESKKNKFQKEMDKEPFRGIKKRYRFISYEELFQFIEISKRFNDLKNKLLGESI